VDRSVNPNALWHGLAFTDDCNGAGLDDRHVFDNVDFSNTEYAAITAGSRPAPKLDGTAQDAALSCGDAANDCDAGEFIMTAVTFTNVDSAFAHGSGQGTTVNMDNFAVTDARSACFNFAENTIATLTGSAGAPSTMTRCNTNNVWWGGAVVSMPGSTAGSLTMSYVDITDSFVSGIRTDLKSVSIDNVDIVNANNQYPIREINNVLYYPGDQEWESSGVSLELNHAGPGAEIVITDFSAPGYHHGRICSSGKIVLTNVDLGVGLGPAADGSFANHEDFFAIKSANSNGCGGTGLGTFGADSSFDNFDVGNLYFENTFPTMSNMDIDGVLVFSGLTVAGAPTDPISLTNVVASDKFEVDSCGANVEASGLTTSIVKSVCSVPGGKNFVTITSSTITHTDTFESAIVMEQTRGTMIGVDVQSATINANGPYIAYAGYDADVYLVEVNLVDGGVSSNCADNSVGMSTTCHIGKAAVGIGNTVPVLYAGSYASATAYRLGSDTSTTPPTPTQIAQTGVSITASTLDSTGAEIFGHTIGVDTTDSTGVANNVIVITGDDSGTVYDSHHIRASGPAGAGEAHPLLADGTPASEQQFVNGALQVPPTAFGTYNIGSNVDVRLTAPPVTFDDTGMDCSWMANNATFANADPNGIGTYVFRGATMVLASSMTIDNCNVVLEGSKLIWREDTLNNPTLTVTGTGTLTLALDPDTGDLPKIYGEGNLDAVDLAIGSGGVVDFQAGTMKNLLMDNSKDGLIVLEEGSTLKLAGNAFVTGADTSTMGTSQYPLIYMDGGLLEVNSATLAGTGNVGVGVYNSDAGQIKGSGLTVTNMEIGLHAYYGSIELDDYTSTGNTNGIIAEGSPSLPQIYSSAVLQGITTNTPYSASSNGMNHCRSAHFIECYQWETYTVDLSSWVGIDDYIQPSMMLNYGGTYRSVWSGWGSVYPYVSMDNLKITMTDTSGNSWVVDGTSNNGVGYYPYSATDPAVTNGGATYMGGQGGPAAYDCNNYGTSLTPWRFGTGVYWDYAGSPQTLGTVWGNSDNGYGEGFGFRWNQGTIPHAGSSFHSYPRLNWGMDEPYTGRFGVGSSLGAGYKTTSTSPNGVYEVCSSYASPYTVPGLNTLLEWPTVDISDPSIENVELSFDYWHRYSGSAYPWYPSWVAFYNNNNPDNMELLARSGDDPGNFGDYSKEVKGFGTTITNSQITDANIAIDIKGDVLATITNMDIDNPTSFAVRTSGANDIVLDGLDVDDSSAGANTNYGFYTTSTSTGTQEVRNSNFNGLGTAIYVNNDVGTSITNTVVANGDVGIKIGSQSEANHQFTDVTVNNNNKGILAEGIGKITMTNVNIQGASATSIDLEITDSNEVEFLDGEITQSLITIDPTSAGKFTRDRSYFAVIEADGATLADTNVIMSSRDAAKSSSGVTDANGVTSGLRFGVYSMDSTGLTDFTQFLNTYSISSVAKVSYSFTDLTTNDGDFRYIQTSPTLLDAPYDSTTNTNYQSYSLVDNIDVRVCTNDATSLVVANCAGTLSSSGDRVYTSGMLEFGDTEAIDSTVDLTNKAIMIDSGLFELRDGVTYDMSNSVVFHTGVDTQFGGGGIGQWISDAPYGTTVKMHGGEINGLMQANDAGDAAGLIIGGIRGTNYENPMGLDFDGVSLNNIAGLATSNGDLTTGAWSGLSNYQPAIISIKNSFINHYRGYFYYPSQYFDLDYCVRLQGGTGGDISGNTFSDCTMGVVFMDSSWHSTGSTSQSHSQVGADGIIIKDNTFVGASGWNVYAWPDADADFIEVTDNDMSCALCGHVRFRDDTSVSPTVEGNTFNNGQYGVYTTDTEYVVINDNTFNNQENMAIRANEGDFDVTNNVINNAGTYAIYADSLEKPDEVIETVIAGINSPQPDDGVSYVSCGYSTVTCPDVQATLSAGEEMIMKVTCGSWCTELRVDWKDPATGLWNTWDPTAGYAGTGSELYSNVDGTAQYVLNGAGTWFFNLWDTYGDGINGGQLEIIKANAGAWSSQGNQNPIAIYDPGCCGGGGLNTYQSYSGGSDGHSNTDAAQYVLQNTGTTDITYEFRMNDNYGDGANGNSFEMYTAQVGTWNSASNGPTGVYVGGINDGRYGSPSFTTGSQSAAVVIILPANQEMKFVFDCVSWCGESYMQWQEIFVANTLWDGPEISGNDINFDTTNNDPLAVALYLGNCDMADYSINTESNTIDIGQNAVENEGCVWNDKDSVITGADVANSIGYNDDNAYAAVLELDGTTISGFGTGVYKTTSGTVLLTGGASITAGTGGIGVHTKDIDVSVIDATVDGGLTGTGIMVEDSSYAWFYPMDVSGNVGIHAINSEILWDVGTSDANTAIRTENVQGTIQSITESSTGGTQIDAQTDSSLTVIDFPLDETRMLVDSSSIVDEANWLNIDATHLGGEPANDVGLIMTSTEDYAAYNSPIFSQAMLTDGDSADWFGGNTLNPSGYAMPGAIGGGMLLTTSNNELVVGFDQASTATSDVYIYVDSAPAAGSDTGFNNVHTLPSAADYVIKVTSTSTDVYSYSGTAWVLDPSANAQSSEVTVLEVSAPLSSIGASGADSIGIVGVVQDIGTDTMTAVSPAQTITSTGPESLTDNYDLELSKLDLTIGDMVDEVVLHRSFEGSSTPSPLTGHTYDLMVKTAAEVEHSCDYDWATETGVVMDSTKSLTFDILRACPVITNLLGDIVVDEDTGDVTFDLATYVDDEQDVEANMAWDVTESNLVAHDNVLTNWNDLQASTGTATIKPLTDQFGTFDLTFEVVDSHGQTVSKTITYTVNNINDAPVICDARADVDPNCDTGDIHIYSDTGASLFNVRNEGFGSYSKLLGDIANDTANSFIRDMANEQSPVAQKYDWTAASDCDQMTTVADVNADGNTELAIVENTNWEYGGVCLITLDLIDDGAENTAATSVDVEFSVAPVNDAPEICDETDDPNAINCLVESTDASNAFNADGANYRLTLVEDTTDSDALTFDLANIKSDIDHLMPQLTWELTDTNSCNSGNYYTTTIVGDTLNFDLITDATTNAQPWEVDMLNNNGIHQTRTATGYCDMTLTLSDTPTSPAQMPNYTLVPSSNYVQESVSVTLSVKVDNVVENVPDYFLDATEGFDFNGVNNIMPGTYVPVDFSINAGGDEGPYTYNHLLIVELHTDGHTESELPRIYTPPAYGQTLDIDDWEVYMTDETTEVWVEIDVVTCEPGAVCTPAVNTIQNDNPESHNLVNSATVFGKWSEPGRIGESSDGTQQSNRRPAFEDKNWCNNLMSSNAGTGVAWSDATSCGHSDQGYNGPFAEDWQTGDNKLPVTVSTIGALSVASFAPSIIAVALTGLFVSALVFAGRRDDDEEEIMEQKMSDDESAVSPVIATILMVAITVVLSGVVYVWAAQLADTDTKGVPRVTFSAENVDTANTDTDHWKITIGNAQTVLATQAIEVTVTYINATGDSESQKINLASTQHVYGFSPFNSDSLVTFGDVVTIDGEEVISTFSTGDDIYVKTHLSDGTPLVDARIVITYNPPGDAQGAVLKTYSGMSWNQPV
jgi:flagellin-like protein